MVTYPNLVGEMARRGIKRKDVADAISVSYKALSNKLSGKAPFTWPEVVCISNTFFPDVEKDTLFLREDEIFATKTEDTYAVNEE